MLHVGLYFYPLESDLHNVKEEFGHLLDFLQQLRKIKVNLIRVVCSFWALCELWLNENDIVSFV